MLGNVPIIAPFTSLPQSQFTLEHIAGKVHSVHVSRIAGDCTAFGNLHVGAHVLLTASQTQMANAVHFQAPNYIVLR